MTDYDAAKIQDFIDRGLTSRTTKEQGDALEDLVCYLLEGLPGIKTKRNVVDRSKSCEIDVIVANCQYGWMTQYPKHFFVECKNWGKPVDSKAVRDFAMKMEDRSVEIGVLVTANGIRGKAADITAAYQEIVLQQVKGRRIVVVHVDQLRTLKSPSDFEMLLVDCLLVTVGLTRS